MIPVDVKAKREQLFEAAAEAIRLLEIANAMGWCQERDEYTKRVERILRRALMPTFPSQILTACPWLAEDVIAIQGEKK